MIDHFELQEFKGHRDTRLTLGRLTMLVGDNASGKTSVLEALALFSAFGEFPAGRPARDLLPADLVRRGVMSPMQLRALGATAGRTWTTTLEAFPPTTNLAGDAGWAARLSGALGAAFSAQVGFKGSEGSSSGPWEVIGETIGVARLYLFHAARIAAAAFSLAPDAPVESDGANTAIALESMKLGNDEAFERVEVAMRALIPCVERVRIRPAVVQSPRGVENGRKIYFDFRGAPGIPAHGASHGTLILLALLTVLHGEQRPNLILLDDLDHALHPRAQIELVRMLQKLLDLEEFADLQIVATTHSPYVLDELEPSQIHAFALRDDGTVATKPLAAHPEADKVKGTLTAGQLWSLDPEREWVLRG